MRFRERGIQKDFFNVLVLNFQKIFALKRDTHCEEMLQCNTGLHQGFFNRPYPQNVNISGYELQILKNIFVMDVNTYLTREILF